MLLVTDSVVHRPCRSVGHRNNILNILILSRERIRKVPTSVYLLCLSVSDITFLWTAMVPRMLQQAYNLDIRTGSQFFCTMISWLPVTTAGYSVWILALLTLERVFLTKMPVIAKSKLNRRFSIAAAIVTLLVCVLSTGHVLAAAKIKQVGVYDENGTLLDSQPRCVQTSYFATFYKETWPLTLLIGLNLVPMMITLSGNITIFTAIISQRKKINITLDGHSVPNRIKNATKLLFVVSAFFIVTTAPFTIGNVTLASQSTVRGEERATQTHIHSATPPYVL